MHPSGIEEAVPETGTQLTLRETFQKAEAIENARRAKESQEKPADTRRGREMR